MREELYTAYSTLEQQDKIEKEILEVKNKKIEKKVRFNFGSSDEEQLLIRILEYKEFPALAELYTRYRNDSTKISELAQLNAFLLDPKLFQFWVDILGKKTKLRAFSPTVPLRRHRLKSQPDDQPDEIHPFHLLVGNFYIRSILSRYHALAALVRAEGVLLANNNWQSAFDTFMDSWKRFRPWSRFDSECYETINKEIETLKETNTEDFEKILNTFNNIRQQMTLLKGEQQRELHFGMHYKAYTAYSIANIHDMDALKIAVTSGAATTDSSIKMIDRMVVRMPACEDIHGTFGFLATALLHYHIGRTLKEVTQQIEKNLLPLNLPTPPHQACGIDSFYMPLTKRQIGLKTQRQIYERIAIQHFQKAIEKMDIAIRLHNSGEYDDLTQNAIRKRKKITDDPKLKLDGYNFDSIEALRDYLILIEDIENQESKVSSTLSPTMN